MRWEWCQALLAILLFAMPAMAKQARFALAPFALFEQSTQTIVINGVTSRYSLGVLGLKAQMQIFDHFKVIGKFGYGQNNDQAVSFSGAKFHGKVRGSYHEASGHYTILETSDYIIQGGAKFLNRRLNSPNLEGSRNGQALTGTAETTIKTTDAFLSFQYLLSDTTTMKVAAGYHQWHLMADARGYYASNGLTATARKKIDAVGLDPIFEISISNFLMDRVISAKIGCRSLHSETNTEILTAELIYQINF